MAMPIKPTPVLKEDEAIKFLEKVKENLNKPSYWKPTPKLAEAKKLAMRNAVVRSK